MGNRDQLQREVLPIPDRPPVGLTTYDAKAPDTSRPNTCAPLAETLKPNGYATAQFGKCHEDGAGVTRCRGLIAPRGHDHINRTTSRRLS